MIFVPFNLHKFCYSNSILSIQLASSECFSPSSKSLISSLPFPWHPHPGCSFLALLSSHSPSVKAETKHHLIWEPSLTFPALIFLCVLNSLHFWAFADQFGIQKNHILPCPCNSWFKCKDTLFLTTGQLQDSKNHVCINKLFY